MTLFIQIMSASIYWIFRFIHKPRGALIFLIITNILFLTIINPLLFTYLFSQVLLVLVIYFWIRRINPSRPGFRPWLSFIGLLPVNYELWFGRIHGIPEMFGSLGKIGLPEVFWTLGATFFVIKTFIMLKESLRMDVIEPLPMLANLSFLPTFPAGPICGVNPWRYKNVGSGIFDPAMAFDIFMKIGWGGACLYVFSPELKKLALMVATYKYGIIFDMYLSFASVFFDFAGYSFMAIGFAAMYGIKLPMNFDKPYLATSIADFWRRWHMSLSTFIRTHLYQPLVRHYGRPRLCIVVAFLFVGIWHKFTIGYVLWGLGNGLALSLSMNPPAFWRGLKEKLPASVYLVFCWFLTISLVSSISFVANKSGL